MLAILVVRALALVSFTPSPTVADVYLAPCVMHYQGAARSVRGAMPWGSESLNPSGVGPSIVAKGAL